MKRNLRILSGLAGVFLTFAIMVSAPGLVESNAPGACFSGDTCLHEEYVKTLSLLIPAFIGIGAVLGAVALYVFYERKESMVGEGVALSLMEGSERAVVGRIVKEGGRITQSEISRMGGLGKVKAHRVLRGLEKRGIVEMEHYGKTNMVKLSGKYRPLFFGGE